MGVGDPLAGEHRGWRGNCPNHRGTKLDGLSPVVPGDHDASGGIGALRVECPRQGALVTSLRGNRSDTCGDGLEVLDDALVVGDDMSVFAQTM